MKRFRFIRTKGGRIIDTTKTQVEIDNGAGFEQLIIKGTNEVIVVEKESENILDLIQVGDLVKFIGKGICCLVCSIDEVCVCDYAHIHRPKEYITEIYTKQGNDYILVARKNGKGEWEVL